MLNVYELFSIPAETLGNNADLYRNMTFPMAEIIMDILQGCQSKPPGKDGERNRKGLSSRLVPLNFFSVVSFAPSLRCPRLNYSPIKHLHKISYVLGIMTSIGENNSVCTS